MSGGGGPIAGLGKVPLWGHSPAVDFFQYLNHEQKREGETIRILLVGQTDLRHVLETLTQNWDFLESNNMLIEFYLAEEFPEVISRQMLLLVLAIQPLLEIGLNEKSLQWLELFGNSLLRPKTNKTLMDMTEKLIELLSSNTEQNVFDLSDLKFREKDDLFEIFNHWKGFAEIFPIQDHWKKRVEKHLGVRYDVRENVFDWDYNMQLADNAPCVISLAGYKKWRNTGIAFAEFDSEYSQPNVSLVTGISTGGGAFLSYRGEIVTGPFIPFGIEADDPSLFKTENGKHKSTAFDISLHNIQRYFSAIAATNKPLSDHIRVSFLSPSAFCRPRFFGKFSSGFFDAGFFSAASAQYLIPLIVNLFKPGATILVEDTRYFIELRSEQRTLYRQKIFELASESKLEPISTEGSSVFFQFEKSIKSASAENESVVENVSDACANDILTSFAPPASTNPQDAKIENEVTESDTTLGNTLG